MTTLRKRRRKKRSKWQRLCTRLDKLDPSYYHVCIILVVILFFATWWSKDWNEAVQITTYCFFLLMSASIGSWAIGIIIAGLEGELDRKGFKVIGIRIAIVGTAFLAMLVIDYNVDLWYKVIFAGLGVGSALVLFFEILFRLWRL